MKQAFTLWCLLMLTSIVPLARAEVVHGVVIAVIDGDTILFKPDPYHSSRRAFLKVRLADIDAPENDQPYGSLAARALTARVLHRQVAIDTVATDIYGRTIAHVRRGEHEIGTEMVQTALPGLPPARGALGNWPRHSAGHG